VAALTGSSEIATLGLRVEANGLLVTGVQTGSTAFFAGFQPGDLIVTIDQVYLDGETMPARIGYFKSGDQLGVTCRFVVECELSEEPFRTALMGGVFPDPVRG
jgi:predicted metalloprotease with PDZ domain